VVYSERVCQRGEVEGTFLQCSRRNERHPPCLTPLPLVRRVLSCACGLIRHSAVFVHSLHENKNWQNNFIPKRPDIGDFFEVGFTRAGALPARPCHFRLMHQTDYARKG